MKDIVWSYTRLSLYETCPHAYYERYIEGKRGPQSAYTQWGILMHDLLELNASGKLSSADMIDTYRQQFDEVVTADFPQWFSSSDVREEYYKAGIGFLFAYNGVPEHWQVLQHEWTINTTIGDGCKLTGRLDLLARDKATDELILLDYKSKKQFRSRKEEALQLRQLYLYAKGVQECYGKFPDKLEFLLLRSNQLREHSFDAQAYEATLAWAVDIAKQASSDIFWEYDADRRRERGLTSVASYCKLLCDYRHDCEALI